MLWLPPEHSRTHLFNKTNSQKKKKKDQLPASWLGVTSLKRKTQVKAKICIWSQGRVLTVPQPPREGSTVREEGAGGRRLGCASGQESPGGSLQGASRVCL